MPCRAGPDFSFISAKAMATVEFLQRKWINSEMHRGCRRARPALGAQEGAATFTTPKQPVRRRSPGHPDVQCAARRGEFLHPELLGADDGRGISKVDLGLLATKGRAMDKLCLTAVSPSADTCSAIPMWTARFRTSTTSTANFSGWSAKTAGARGGATRRCRLASAASSLSVWLPRSAKWATIATISAAGAG